MKKKNSKALIQSQSQEITAEMILAHPIVKEMASRLENVQNLLQNLPEAIGRAVAQATAAPAPLPPLVPGQEVPVLSQTPLQLACTREIELHPQKVVMGGKAFSLPPRPREIPSQRGPRIGI